MTEPQSEDGLGEAVTKFDQGDLEGCLALIGELRVQAGERVHPDALYFEGLCHRRLGNGPLALECLEKACAAEPHDPEYLLEYGLTLIHQGKVQGGLDLLRQAVHESEHAPEYRHELYVQNALALYDEGFVDPCVLSLRKALKFVRDPDTYRLLAEILIENKKHEEALDAIREALEAFPDDSEMHHMAGLALVLGQRPYEAARAFVRACELAPQDPDPLHSLGVCLESIGDSKRALDVYDRCLAMHLSPELRDDTMERVSRLRYRLMQKSTDKS